MRNLLKDLLFYTWIALLMIGFIALAVIKSMEVAGIVFPF